MTCSGMQADIPLEPSSDSIVSKNSDGSAQQSECIIYSIVLYLYCVGVNPRLVIISCNNNIEAPCLRIY
jgi:hypothetical protein